MKKIVSTVLAFCLVLSCLPVSAAAAGSFRDVPFGQYYTEAVDWAVENGITSGTGTNTFSPNSKCTRGQIVTFLWRAAGKPSSSYPTQFSDVHEKEYYAEAVKWAVETGITSGTSRTAFSPNAGCTRAQAVTFLYRAAGEPVSAGTNSFGDVPVGAYYSNAVGWAVENKITAGTSATSFSPNSGCTRAQIVTFLYRFLGGWNEPDKPELTRRDRIQRVCDIIEKNGLLSANRRHKFIDFMPAEDEYVSLNYDKAESSFELTYEISRNDGVSTAVFVLFDLQRDGVEDIFCGIEDANGRRTFLNPQIELSDFNLNRKNFSYAIASGSSNGLGWSLADLRSFADPATALAFLRWEYMLEKLGSSLQDFGFRNYKNIGVEEGPLSGNEFLSVAN